MPLPAPLRTRLRRLRSGLPRPDTMGTGLTLAVVALLIVLGVAVSILTWRQAGPPADEADSALSPPEAVDTPATGAVPAEPRAVRVERLADSTSAEELARQLQDAPQGRWAYALRSSDRRDRSAAPPPVPPPRRIVSVVPESALGFAWPLAGVITSAFTDRHPLGIDIGPAESPGLVLAARDGVVVSAGGDPCCGYGYFVMLDHGGGLTSLYGHLQEPPLVRAGERLERGTVLGYAGETGHAHGVHLHFEVRLYGLPVDPEIVLTGGQLVPLPIRPRATSELAPPAESPPQSGPTATIPPELSPVESVAGGVAPEHAPSQVPTPEQSVAPPPALTPSPLPAPPPSPRPAPPSSPSPLPRAEPAPSPSPETATAPDPDALPSPSAAAGTAPGEAATAASPTPAGSPSAAAAETPRCESIHLRGAERGSRTGENAVPPAFITLEADAEAVTSLVAERCRGGTAISVVAVPAGNRRCGATLTVREGDRSRRLTPERTSDGEIAPSGETRWLIPLADLWPDPVLRVVCTPVEAVAAP